MNKLIKIKILFSIYSIVYIVIVSVIFFFIQKNIDTDYIFTTIYLFFVLIVSSAGFFVVNKIISLNTDKITIQSEKTEIKIINDEEKSRITVENEKKVKTSKIFKTVENEIIELNEFTSTINEYAQKQSESNEEVQAVIETLKFYIDSIYEKMETHDSVIQDTTQNLENIVVFVDNISKSSKKANEQSNELYSITNILNKSMAALFSSIDKISDVSQSIGNVVIIIENIAEKTNLLSINAAIEAARVGESGRGFNVLSTEIRKLSNNTTNHVKEINTLIKDITGKINTSLVNREEAERKLKDINTGISTMNERIDEIINESNTQKSNNQKIINEIADLRENSNELKEDITEGYESSHEIIDITNKSIIIAQKIYDISKEETNKKEIITNFISDLKKVIKTDQEQIDE